jgi:hypothetical protein
MGKFCVSVFALFLGAFGLLYGQTPTLSGNNVFTGKDTSPIINNVIYVDGTKYKTLQSAIQACKGMAACVVDARNPAIGTQTFTTNPFSGLNMPITLLTGPYTVQWDVNDLSAVTVDLPSNLTWILNGTTIQPNMTNVAIPATAFLNDTAGNNANNGGSGQGMLNTRVYGVTGTIAAGSNSLTVSRATNLLPGMAIAIVGGVGGMVGQQTKLNGALTTGSTQLTLVNAKGFPKPASSNSTLSNYNYIIIDSEIIGWKGINGNTLQNLARGQFGSTITAHNDQATLSALGTLVTEITDIAGSTVTLLDRSSLSLTETQVQAGAINVFIQGTGNITGNYVD